VKHECETFQGVLLGTAVGDALGLPAEGMSPERIRKRWRGEWRMRFVFGRGMVSDDTEHTLMVAQALLAHPEDAAAFQRSLAWKLRWWLLGLPAGVGLGTARACLKLWLGFPPHRSGVRSAGNGPAMRSAIIGVEFAGDPVRRRAFVTACTRLTHTDPRAETAALAVAEFVAGCVNGKTTETLLQTLRKLSEDAEWMQAMDALHSALRDGRSGRDFALSLGLARGVTGYAYHTVPVALHACLRHPGDFRAALTAALDCGGDTDTVGAIVGALAGAQGGASAIPREWVEGLCEWPRSVRFMREVSRQMTEEPPASRRPVPLFWPGVLLRNVCFLLVVLLHGFRRLLP